MDTEKVGKIIKICGFIFIAGCFVTLIGFQFTTCSAKPLEKDENRHWISTPMPTSFMSSDATKAPDVTESILSDAGKIITDAKK